MIGRIVSAFFQYMSFTVCYPAQASRRIILVELHLLALVEFRDHAAIFIIRGRFEQSFCRK